MQPTGEKYALAIRILHWLMAAIIIGLIIVGLIMEDVPRTDPLRGTLFSLHKSFGITILALAALRILLRLRFGAPPLPATIPAHERFLAHLGHLALYGFMLAMPISGYTMSSSSGLPVKWFGIALPRLFGVNRGVGKLAQEFHELAAYTLIGMLVLHVSAVIVHYLRQRVNLLKRML